MKYVLIVIVISFSCLGAYAQNNTVECPKIELFIPKQPLTPEQPVVFSLKVGNTEDKLDLRYFWVIRGGTILKGYGTTQLEFSANDEDNGSNLTVAVKVTGLPNNCPDTVSAFVPVNSLPIGEPIDSFGKLSIEKLRERLDSYLPAIQNDRANSEGLIHLVFDKNERRRDKLTHLMNVLAFLDFRKFDKTRITFAISEGNRQATVLWIVPQGAKFPEYSSASGERISEANSQIFKAEELKQKINDICLKNGTR